jgi:hypothetical protein
MQYLLQQVRAGFLARGPWWLYLKPTSQKEVSKQHADHSDRQCGVGRHVGDSDWPHAQTKDLAMFGAEVYGIIGLRGPSSGDDNRDQI